VTDDYKRCLWEILVPTVSNDGKPFRTRFHRVWDKKVREISYGVTIMTPAKGQWISDAGRLYEERMIPVRIYTNKHFIKKIAKMTAEYYSQLAVMVYKISDDVMVVNNHNHPYVNDLPDYGDLFTLSEFIDSCKNTLFTNDDGHGYLVKNKKMQAVEFYPSQALASTFESDATHVMWFNK